MSIYTYLKKDHKLVKELINEIEKVDGKDAEARNTLFNKLKQEVIVHSKAEDKIFYKPLNKKESTEKEIPHARDEHGEIEKMLEQLSDSSLEGKAWTKLFKTMTAALLHHMEEEENEIFSDAKKELSAEKAEQMETAIKKEKKQVMKELDISKRTK